MNMEREQIIKALADAPLVSVEDIAGMKSSTEAKIRELNTKGIPNLKGLWVLTSYRNEKYPNLIIDTDVTGADETVLDAAVFKFVPHNGCYKLTCEVLGEEDNMFTGTEQLLQREIMDGRVRKIYTAENWGADRESK